MGRWEYKPDTEWNRMSPAKKAYTIVVGIPLMIALIIGVALLIWYWPLGSSDSSKSICDNATQTCYIDPLSQCDSTVYDCGNR